MRGAAAASGTAAAAACTQHPLARSAPRRHGADGRSNARPALGGAAPGRGRAQRHRPTAPRRRRTERCAPPPAHGTAGRCSLLGGAVAGVGLAEGRGLFLELLTSGRHVVLKDCFCPSFLLRASRQRRVFLLHLRPNGCKFCDAPRSEASPGETSPLSRSRRPPDDAPTGASTTRTVPVFSTTRTRWINAGYPSSGTD